MARCGAFLIGLAVALAYWPGLLSAGFVPRWAALAVLVPLLWRLDGRHLPDIVRYGVGGLLALCAVSLLPSPDPWGGAHDLMLIAILVMVFFGASGLDRLDDVFRGLGVGLAVTLPVIIMQAQGWRGLPMIGAMPGGLFLNSEILAEFAALLLVWACVRRELWLIAVAAVPVALCESRVAGLSAVFGIAYALWPRRRAHQIAVAAILVMVCVAGVLLMGEYKFSTAGHRMTLWGATVLSWTPFGNGLGWFQTAFPGPRFAHSDALQAVSEIGVGALLLLLIPVKIFLGERKHVAERAVFAAVCLQVAVSFPLHFPATGFVAAAVAGWLLGMGRVVRLGNDQRRTDDVGDFQRPGVSGSMDARAGRPSGAALPLRLLSAWHARRAAIQPAGSGG